MASWAVRLPVACIAIKVGKKDDSRSRGGFLETPSRSYDEGMTVTLGEVFVGIAAIAGGIGLLLSYRREARRRVDLIAEFKRREISASSHQHSSDENPK